MKKALSKKISVAWVLGIASVAMIIGGAVDHFCLRQSPPVEVLAPQHGLSGLSGDSGLSGIAGGNPVRIVNATTGNDANNGLTKATAWKTWSKVSSSLSSLPTNTYILIDPSGGPLQLTSILVFGGRSLGSTAPGTYAELDVNVALPSSGWTNPSGVIWKLAAGGTTRKRATVTYKVASVMTMFPVPVIGANFAAVTTDLQANAGSYWADPANGDLYIHTPTGSNPNSDGITYYYAPDFTNGTDSLLIDVSHGRADWICLVGGGTLDPTQGTTGNATAPVTQCLGADDLSVNTTISNCKVECYTKHAFETAANNEGPGIYSVVNCIAGIPPPGFFAGGYSGFVTFSSAASGNGTAVTRHIGCVDNGSGFTTHNNGAGTNQFFQQVFTNCTIGGAGTSFGAAETRLATLSGNTFTGPVTIGAATTTSSGDTFQVRTPALAGNSTLTNPIFTVNTSLTNTPQSISGTHNLVNPHMDWSGGNNFTTAWTRGGAYSFTATGGWIIPFTNPTYGLIEVFTAGADTLTLSGVDIRGPSGTALIHNYNGTGNSKSYYDAFAGGLTGISATSCTHNGIPFATPTPPASILASDIAEFWDFVSSTEMWQDTTFNTRASANTNPVRVAAGSYYGSAMLAPSTGKRGLRSAGGLVLDAVDDGATSPTVLNAGSTGYAIVCVEKLTGAGVGGLRTVQSETLGNRLGSLSRGAGDNFYLGGDISTFRVAPDGARHVWIINCPASGGGNIKVWVDGVDRTTGAIAAADWGQVCIGTGSGGAGAAAESADTTICYFMLVKRMLTNTEITNLTTALQAMP